LYEVNALDRSGLHVAVLTTGGTIAMEHDEGAGGAIPQLDASDFSAALASGLPSVQAEAIVNLPSSHFTLDALETIEDLTKAYRAVLESGEGDGGFIDRVESVMDEFLDLDSER